MRVWELAVVVAMLVVGSGWLWMLSSIRMGF